MQFFTMVNRLLAVNPETCKQELFVRTYSVTPLSDNCGLISWVDRHDTLHSLIKMYRESKHAEISAEYQLMKRVFHTTFIMFISSLLPCMKIWL